MTLYFREGDLTYASGGNHPLHTTPGEPCPTCNRRVPVPEEKREPKVRGQLGLTFDDPATADSCRVLINAARERLDAHLGTSKRVRMGDIVIYVLHDWLT